MIGRAPNSRIYKNNMPALSEVYEEAARPQTREGRRLERLAMIGGYKMIGLSPDWPMTDDFSVRRRIRPAPSVPVMSNLGASI